MKTGKSIHFHFHPKGFDKKENAVEKADEQGRLRRYLCGVSSGLSEDAHGERMSGKCIKSFQSQAGSGEILLFPDIHGIKESEDIGILTKAEILDNGDWYTEYRLYDEYDDVGPNKLEKADTIWKQTNGLPPYKRRRQKGFSIEGVIPEESLVVNSVGQVDRTVIDDILLDGVVLVPRPAYQDSIASAIFKALGEVSPHRAESIQNTLRDNLEQQDISDNYYRLKWQYMDALEQTIEKIMIKKNNNKREELKILFEEFKDLMTELILKSERMFASEQDVDQLIDIVSEAGTEQIHTASIEEEEDQDPKLELFKSLRMKLNKLDKYLEEKNA